MVRRLIPLLLWTAVVLGFSSDSFGHESTSRTLLPLLRWLLPGADPSLLEALHYAIRKSAHAAEYGLLAALALRALLGVASLRRRAAAAAALAFAYCLVVASADEIAQSRTTLRSGAASDVALDLAGSAAALAFVHHVQRRCAPSSLDPPPDIAARR